MMRRMVLVSVIFFLLGMAAGQAQDTQSKQGNQQKQELLDQERELREQERERELRERELRERERELLKGQEPKRQGPKGQGRLLEVDFAPNPFDDDLEKATENYREADKNLKALYNSFDFRALIRAYDVFVKARFHWMLTREKWVKYEEEHSLPLLLQVRGVDLTRLEPIAFPCQPAFMVDDKRDASAIRTIAPLGKRIKAKVTITELPESADSIKHTWETGDRGLLLVRHFKKGQRISIKVEASGHFDAVAELEMLRPTKKAMYLETVSASVKGMVYGLSEVVRDEDDPDKLKRPDKLQRIDTGVKAIPLPGAKITFTHVKTNYSYSAVSADGKWPFERIVPLDWDCDTGRYYISRMMPGEYKVSVTAKKNYEPFESKETISLQAGADAMEQDFYLLPVSIAENSLLDEEERAARDAAGVPKHSGSESNADLNNPLKPLKGGAGE